jgi:hypothetical protein
MICGLRSIEQEVRRMRRNLQDASRAFTNDHV